MNYLKISGQRFFSNCPDPVCPVPKIFRDSPVCPAGRDKRDFSGFGTVPQDSSYSSLFYTCVCSWRVISFSFNEKKETRFQCLYNKSARSLFFATYILNPTIAPTNKLIIPFINYKWNYNFNFEYGVGYKFSKLWFIFELELGIYSFWRSDIIGSFKDPTIGSVSVSESRKPTGNRPDLVGWLDPTRSDRIGGPR
jgi:hypothetical protein